jgi:eukaryotic-like serine/threonine-protein kinase
MDPTRDDATDPPAELRALVERALDRMESEGPQALEALCREHPEHAAALRRRVGELARMGFVEVKDAKHEFPERLGEFRLLQPLGGGGMGVVYLAEQEPLGRKVALKLIRPEHLYFPGARERFQREVDAVARLQHPGIVPVYTVGEAEGVPYFAMEHVAGKSLAQCIADLKALGKPVEEMTGEDLRAALGAAAGSSGETTKTGSGATIALRGRWVSVCLRIVREVAFALEHAHQRGVLHRDVKPSNVMLTADGRVMLLDFGLAIAQDATRITRSGALVGSLPYMAPEQVLGDAASIGVATDVYALGVTLYELLTLRLPHAQTTVDELQRAIVTAQPDPPSRVNPAIPWDVDTVCLKAMDGDRARRYADAEAFARDLSNVLEFKPIEAQRPSAILRTRRYVQRHPARVLGITLLFLLVVGGPAFYAWLERGRRLEVAALNQDLEASLKEANLQRIRAERNHESALAAIDSMLLEVGDKELADVPLMEGVRQRLLERALDLYRSFSVDAGDDPKVATRVAECLSRGARILVMLGRHEDARAQFESALAAWQELAKRDVDGDFGPAAIEAARAAVGVVIQLRELGDLDAAVARAGVPRAILERRIAGAPDDGEARIELSVLEVELARVELSRKDSVAAEAFARSATSRLEGMPVGPSVAKHRAAAWNEIGMILMRAEASYPARADEIEDAFRRGIAAIEEVPESERTDPELRLIYAIVLQDLAGHFRRLERFADAEPLYARALTELESLAAGHPERLETRRQLATVINNLGLVAELSGRGDEALARYGDVVNRLEELARAAPRMPDLLSNLGIAWVNYSFQASRRGDRETEVERLKNARATFERAIALSPDNVGYRDELANVLWTLMNVNGQLGRREDAVEAVFAYADNKKDTAGIQARALTGLARCVNLLANDEELSEDEVAARRVEYATHALTFVARLKELAPDLLPKVATTPDLAPLRAIEEFRAGLREFGLEVADEDG